jgi:hypothetical protein
MNLGILVSDISFTEASTDFSSLYLMVFKDAGVFKIGKANDVYVRSVTLQKHWGDVSYDESFELCTTRKTVFKLEKSLHSLLAEFAVEFTGGDGKTEMFEIDAMDLALKYLSIYADSSSVPTSVVKGIAPPVICSGKPRHSKHRKKRVVGDAMGLGTYSPHDFKGSKYAWRLFELLKDCQSRKGYRATTEEFCESMEVPPSCCIDFKALRLRVIEPAVLSIIAATSLSIEWAPIKSGARRVTSLEFRFALTK